MQVFLQGEKMNGYTPPTDYEVASPEEREAIRRKFWPELYADVWDTGEDCIGNGVNRCLCPECSKPMVHVKKGRMRYTMCIDPNCPSKAKWRKSGNEKDN